MHLTVKRWGNSYALRLTRRDLERFGIKEGSEVDVEIKVAQERIDLSGLPVFRSGKSMTLDQARDDAAAWRVAGWQK